MLTHDNLASLVAEAWPAPYQESHGDGVFRYAEGVTKRANSVLVRGERPQGGVEAAGRYHYRVRPRGPARARWPGG